MALRPAPETRTSLFGFEIPAEELPATTVVVPAAKIRERQPDRPEDALFQAGVALPSVSQAGLNTAFNVRGFDIASRLQYNGHPDFQRLFVRDLTTVGRIEVLKGHLSVLYGQGARGATLNYVGKRPMGLGVGSAAIGIGSFGTRRIEFDLDSAPAAVTYRLVFAGHAGEFKSNIGGNATDSNDYIVYDRSTGNLYYDADGNGAGAKALFTTLSGLAGTLGHTDFTTSLPPGGLNRADPI